MTLTASRTAPTDAPVLDVIADRWSPRVFDAFEPIDEDALASALEAARWAPSAYNGQPWRFIVARRGTDAHAAIVDTLTPFNQAWAAPAAALVVFASTTADDGEPTLWNAYDTGQAAAYFAIQAQASGLHTHPMSGFDRADLGTAFGFGDDVAAITVVAVGTLGDLDAAPEALRERDLAPRSRRPVAESVLLNA